MNRLVRGHVTRPLTPPQQKVDDDGFTEVGERRRGGNRNRYNQRERGTTPGSYRNNNRDRGTSNNRSEKCAVLVSFFIIGVGE